MPITAVFLDLGNTLLTERNGRAAVYSQEGRRAGLDVEQQAMATRMARAFQEMPLEVEGAYRYSDAWFRAFQRRIFVDELGLRPAAFERLSEQLFARFEEAATFTLYPGAAELLAALRARGLRIGLVSNWSERLPRLLTALGLSTAFDFVLSSAQVRMEKPDPGIFHAAARLADAPGSSCLHAGDRVDLDARGALGAGLQAVLVDHARQWGQAAAPCPVVTSLPDLQDLILARAA